MTTTALRVQLSAETAAYRKGLLDAQKETLRLQKTVGELNSKLTQQNAAMKKNAAAQKSLSGGMATVAKYSKAAVGAVTALVGVGSLMGLTGFIKRQLDAAETLKLTTQRLGVATSAYQQIAFAADLSNINQQMLNTALSDFSMRIGQAAHGLGRALPWIERLNLEIRDASGNIKPLETLLIEFSAALPGLSSDAERAAAAMALMGGSGREMLQLLGRGPAELQALMQEFRDLGLVMDDVMIERMAEANDELTKLFTVLRVRGAIAVGEHAKQVTALAAALLDLDQALREHFARPAQAWAGAQVQPRMEELNQEIEKTKKQIELLQQIQPEEFLYKVFRETWPVPLRSMAMAAGQLDIVLDQLHMQAGDTAASTREYGLVLEGLTSHLLRTNAELQKLLNLMQGVKLEVDVEKKPEAFVPAELEDYIAELEQEYKLLKMNTDERARFNLEMERTEAVRKAEQLLQELQVPLQDAERNRIIEIISAMQRQRDVIAQVADETKRAAQAEEGRIKYTDFIAALEQELALLQMTTEEREKLTQAIEAYNIVRDAEKIMREAGLELSGEEKNRIRDLVHQMEEQREATAALADERARAESEAQELDRAADEFREKLKTQNDLFREQIELLNQLWQTGRLTWDEYTKSVEMAYDGMQKLRDETVEDFSEITDAIHAFGRNFSRMLADMLAGGQATFRDLARSFIVDFLEASIHEGITSPLFSALTNWGKGLFTGGNQRGTPELYKIHKGGVIGYDSLPKFHRGGLLPDEVPAVLQRGEGVFTREQMRALGSARSSHVSVEVINNTGAQADVQQERRPDGDYLIRVVVGAVADDIFQGGRVWQAINRTTGIGRSPVRR